MEEQMESRRKESESTVQSYQETSVIAMDDTHDLSGNTATDTKYQTVSIEIPVGMLNQIRHTVNCNGGEDVETWIQQAIYNRLRAQKHVDIEENDFSPSIAERIQCDAQQRGAKLNDLINDYIMLNPSLELTATDQR